MVRRDAPGGEQVADSCLKEQSQAEALLDSMQKVGAISAQFARHLVELRRIVLAHAEHEELELFPALRSVEEARRRDEIGERFERAKARAPTHPHPHASDTAPGEVLLGPIVALADRMRDAIRG